MDRTRRRLRLTDRRRPRQTGAVAEAIGYPRRRPRRILRATRWATVDPETRPTIVWSRRPERGNSRISIHLLSHRRYHRQRETAEVKKSIFFHRKKLLIFWLNRSWINDCINDDDSLQSLLLLTRFKEIVFIWLPVIGFEWHKGYRISIALVRIRLAQHCILYYP